MRVVDSLAYRTRRQKSFVVVVVVGAADAVGSVRLDRDLRQLSYPAASRSVYHRRCYLPNDTRASGVRQSAAADHRVAGRPAWPPPPARRTGAPPLDAFLSRVSAKLKSLGRKGATVVDAPAVIRAKATLPLKKTAGRSVVDSGMEKPMFVTTVKSGAFLEPPPEIAALLGLRKNSGTAHEKTNTATTAAPAATNKLLYSFTSRPRVVRSTFESRTPPPNNARPSAWVAAAAATGATNIRDDPNAITADGSTHYGNTMHDRRVARGSNFASSRCHAQTTEPALVVSRQAEARRRAAVRQRAQIKARKLRSRTPPPIDGRKHEQLQTDAYQPLQQLPTADKEADKSTACQADLSPTDDYRSFSPPPPSQPNNGQPRVDAQTQTSVVVDLNDDNAYAFNASAIADVDADYDDGIHAIVSSMVKKILNEAAVEIDEELNKFRNNETSKAAYKYRYAASRIDDAISASSAAASAAAAVVLTKQELRSLIGDVRSLLGNDAADQQHRHFDDALLSNDSSTNASVLDNLLDDVLNDIRIAVRDREFLANVTRKRLEQYRTETKRRTIEEVDADENSRDNVDGISAAFDSDVSQLASKSTKYDNVFDANKSTITRISFADGTSLPKTTRSLSPPPANGAEEIASHDFAANLRQSVAQSERVDETVVVQNPTIVNAHSTVMPAYDDGGHLATKAVGMEPSRPVTVAPLLSSHTSSRTDANERETLVQVVVDNHHTHEARIDSSPSSTTESSRPLPFVDGGERQSHLPHDESSLAKTQPSSEPAHTSTVLAKNESDDGGDGGNDDGRPKNALNSKLSEQSYAVGLPPQTNGHDVDDTNVSGTKVATRNSHAVANEDEAESASAIILVDVSQRTTRAGPSSLPSIASAEKASMAVAAAAATNDAGAFGKGDTQAALAMATTSADLDNAESGDSPKRAVQPSERRLSTSEAASNSEEELLTAVSERDQRADSDGVEAARRGYPSVEKLTMTVANTDAALPTITNSSNGTRTNDVAADTRNSPESNLPSTASEQATETRRRISREGNDNYGKRNKGSAEMDAEGSHSVYVESGRAGSSVGQLSGDIRSATLSPPNVDLRARAPEENESDGSSSDRASKAASVAYQTGDDERIKSNVSSTTDGDNDGVGGGNSHIMSGETRTIQDSNPKTNSSEAIWHIGEEPRPTAAQRQVVDDVVETRTDIQIPENDDVWLMENKRDVADAQINKNVSAAINERNKDGRIENGVGVKLDEMSQRMRNDTSLVTVDLEARHPAKNEGEPMDGNGGGVILRDGNVHEGVTSEPQL